MSAVSASAAACVKAFAAGAKRSAVAVESFAAGAKNFSAVVTSLRITREFRGALVHHRRALTANVR